METIEKPHVSASQLITFGKCGEAFRRRYVCGDKIPPTLAQTRGKSIHAAAEMEFRQKITSRTDLPASQVVDRAVAEFDGSVVLEDLMLTTEEQLRGKRVVVGEERDRVARLTEVFAERVAPSYQPEAVEVRQRIVIPKAPRDIVGVVDFIGNLIVAPTERGITDYKTTTKASPQSRWDTDPGLSVYALIYRAKYGEPPKFLNVEELIDGATPRVKQSTTTRARPDFEALVARLNAVLQALTQGVFPPAPLSAWWCSPGHCGYWSSCRFVNSERKSAAEKHGA